MAREKERWFLAEEGGKRKGSVVQREMKREKIPNIFVVVDRVKIRSGKKRKKKRKEKKEEEKRTEER